jgi:hypothetical protein
MIQIQPESKSQLLCCRCGHSEDEHNWQSGPCNHKDYSLMNNAPGHQAIACDCYQFVSPLDSRIAPLIAQYVAQGMNHRAACEWAFIELHSEGRI